MRLIDHALPKPLYPAGHFDDYSGLRKKSDGQRWQIQQVGREPESIAADDRVALYGSSRLYFPFRSLSAIFG